MLQALDWLPHSACLWTPLPQPGLDAALHADEAALIADVAPRRRAHFAAGRACAHAALNAIGRDVDVLLRSVDGAPLWPNGVTGSISHCPDAAVAIAADSAHWTALGIDVESDRALPDDAAEYVLSAVERERLAALPGGLARWALSAFAAKECVHKCVHPLGGAFLEFDEVAIHFSFDTAADQAARFVVEPLSVKARIALAGLEWRGELRRQDGLLFSLLAGR
ncbi:4'-phosphopantetheinyl transferase [Nevskia sp.]|uniref:4'-phosphopantetheinyl transferase family protein n=1 Tax=Nevskia sp. TaxID=1929292 RepID=UPI0025E717B8|nr:4'-phosphopantetheinyl transferase superfamily protein [Nevskia sp.]